MNHTTSIVERPNGASMGLAPFTPDDVVRQVALIQEVMARVMRDGEHYGKIPGCGDKPSLLKPGAEKLGLTFRLAPKFFGEREAVDLGGGHREYIIRCELYTIGSEAFVGSGLGSCSTMEAKYRYRSGPKKSTGKAVPSQYWSLRKTEPEKAQALIGGRGFSVGKNEAGRWEIVEQGERVEHDNPADHYNTVLKMAKKRAHVDAILTATAASDCFTQDIEDLKGSSGDEDEAPRGNGRQPDAPPASASPAGAEPEAFPEAVVKFFRLYEFITSKWPERGGDALLKNFFHTKSGKVPTIESVKKFRTEKELTWLRGIVREIENSFDLAEMGATPPEPKN